MTMRFELPTELIDIFEKAPGLEKGYLVGGCVRDLLSHRKVHDYDVEVYGISFEELESQLRKFGRTDLVGKSFGTLKLKTRNGMEFDFSLPRKDSKMGPGHKGFQISVDPSMTQEEACSRRDFTINSMLYHPLEDKIFDPFNGKSDLKKGILRHVGPAFTEDPLRVLRGMQFAGRFNLTAHPDTINLCDSIKDTYSELPKERVWHEWAKWARLSLSPSAGLEFLRQTSWLEHFPWLKELIDIPQDPIWHPEGDVWTHTLHVCDALANLEEFKIAGSQDKLELMFAALTHDFGKPATTEKVFKDGKERIISHEHDRIGVSIAEEFLKAIDCPKTHINRIKPLIAEHINARMAQSSKSIRKLSHRLKPSSISTLCTLMKADNLGRPPLKDPDFGWIEALKRGASELEIDKNPPSPHLTGKDLMAQGLSPSPLFGQILGLAYEAQLEGEISNKESALLWLKTYLSQKREPSP